MGAETMKKRTGMVFDWMGRFGRVVVALGSCLIPVAGVGAGAVVVVLWCFVVVVMAVAVVVASRLV